jgi:hypothetical protein
MQHIPVRKLLPLHARILAAVWSALAPKTLGVHVSFGASSRRTVFCARPVLFLLVVFGMVLGPIAPAQTATPVDRPRGCRPVRGGTGPGATRPDQPPWNPPKIAYRGVLTCNPRRCSCSIPPSPSFQLSNTRRVRYADDPQFPPLSIRR